jgi:hypothetical protein
MFGKIRTKIGRYYFRKEQHQGAQRRQMTNLQDAKHIGIIYTLNDVPDYERISEFVSELQRDHKEVKALGFVKNKNLISRFLPKLSFDFFSKRDVNWFYRPLRKQVKDFIGKEFDILIDLSMSDNFPLKYIAGLSSALCRVGPFSEANTEYYDLMIDAKPAMSTDDFLGQVRHYLTIINAHA